MKKMILSALAVTAMITAIGTNAEAADITLKKGDTLWGLSKQYNVSVKQLKEWNNLSNNTIYANDTLTISLDEGKKQVTEETTEEQYTVVKGDSLWAISQKYGTPVSTLKSWNGLTSDRIFANQKLVVKNGTPQTTATTEEAEKKEEAAVTTETSAQATQQSTSTTTQTAETQSSSVEKTMTVEATAYTANDGGCSGITAAGIDLNANPDMKVIAVDPSVIPLGTKVYVEGYGEAVAGDTGGAIKGNKIDVYVKTKSEAKAWGRKQVTIKILS